MPLSQATRRGCRAAVVVAGVCALIATSALADPTAHATRRVAATEHVTLILVKKTGTKFQHKGKAEGTVAGSVRSEITLTALSIKGTVTVRPKGGTLRLRVSGDARSGGLNAKFDGTATMDGGTGRYAKARGRGTFTGVVNRRSWAATIDAHGSMTY